MNTLAEKLDNALKAAEEARKAEANNPKNFIWKGPKKMVNGELMQEEVKLIDASPEELNKYYGHCVSMLKNVDKNNPGRLVLLDIIKDQRERCNTELLMRYLEGSYKQDEMRKKYPRFEYLKAIREYMKKNPEWFPQDRMHEILVTSVTGSLPDEFTGITLDLVEKGCLYTPLGVFDKKHITLTFITKLGLWLDEKEKKEFNEEAKVTGKTRIDLIKERCSLKPTTNIKISSKGLLNFREFRAMINLRNKRYTELTTDQLVVLRDKVLFALENEVNYHISQWVNKIKEIAQVAEINGIELANFDESLIA